MELEQSWPIPAQPPLVEGPRGEGVGTRVRHTTVTRGRDPRD